MAGVYQIPRIGKGINQVSLPNEGLLRKGKMLGTYEREVLFKESEGCEYGICTFVEVYWRI